MRKGGGSAGVTEGSSSFVSTPGVGFVADGGVNDDNNIGHGRNSCSVSWGGSGSIVSRSLTLLPVSKVGLAGGVPSAPMSGLSEAATSQLPVHPILSLGFVFVVAVGPAAVRRLTLSVSNRLAASGRKDQPPYWRVMA